MKNKSLISSIIILMSILIIKIFYHFKALYNYPFYDLRDFTNHMSRIYFLAVYGFHKLVPHWYNGFILLESYLPGYFYFALPFYLLTKNVVLTMIITIVLIYILGFIFTYILGKVLKFSNLKIIALYLLFFANPLLIISYLVLGRIPEFFTWILFIPFLTLILYYKNHKLDKKSLLFIPIYSLISMSHIYVTSMAAILFFCLFLIKKIKEKIILVLYALISLAISSFAWISFSKVTDKPYDNFLFNPLNELLTKGSIISYNTLFLIFFLITSFFYLKNKNKKEKIFFAPLIIIAILLLTRIAVFTPIINKMPPNAYNVLFLLIGLVLFLKTKLPTFILLLIAISSFFVIIQEPLMGSGLEDKELVNDTLAILPLIKDKFIILTPEDYLPSKSIMSYGILKYNLSTPNGEHTIAARKELIEKGFIQDLALFLTDFKGNCSLLNSSLIKIEAKYVLSYDQYCDFLRKCNLKKVTENNRACLYKKI